MTLLAWLMQNQNLPSFRQDDIYLPQPPVQALTFVEQKVAVSIELLLAKGCYCWQDMFLMTDEISTNACAEFVTQDHPMIGGSRILRHISLSRV